MKTLRRRRLLLTIGIGAPVVFVVLAVALLWVWPGVLRSTLEQRLSDVLGGAVTIGAIDWDDGQLQLDDIRLLAPGIEGDAGDVLTIDRMHIEVSKAAVFTSASMVQSVHIERARLLVAGETGVPESRLNIAALQVDDAGEDKTGASPSGTPPSIIMERLELVIGLFERDVFTQTGAAVFSGRLDGQADGAMYGELHQLDVDQGLVLKAQGMTANGSGHLEASGLRLDETTRGLLPFPAVQSALKTLDLEGQVPLFDVEFEQSRPVHAVLLLDDLSLRLDPDWFGLRDEGGFWASFRSGRLSPAASAPLMRVNGGRIEFEDDQLTVSTLRGELVAPDESSVAVPWSVDLEIESLMKTFAEAKDIESAIDEVAFTLRLTADRFHFDQGDPVVLPRRTARILELFGVQSGSAGIRLQASHAGAGASVEVTGMVTIEDARGAYEQFPYPLTGLNADIDFDLEMVHVRSLHADGRMGSTISIDGQVEASDGDGIDLNITARNVPIDGVFLSAMPDVAAQALRDVLPPERELPSLGSAFSASTVHRTFGDQVDLDLHVGRVTGEPLDISGRISFERLELQWHAFPWPVLLDRGHFDWQEGVLALRSDTGVGVGLRTPDGVVGHIDVAMRLPPLGSNASAAQFTATVGLQVHDQPITGALREAVRVLSPEGGALLYDTNLTGMLDLDAHVQLTTAVPSTFTVVVGIRQGLGDTAGLPVTKGVTLEDLLGSQDCMVDGTIEVQRDAVSLRDFRIVSGERSLELSGAPPGQGETSITGTSLSVGQWVAHLLPESDRALAEDIAHRWGPSGQFDIKGTLHTEHGLHGSIQNAMVSLQGLHPPVTVTQSAGTLELAGDAVRFDAMGIGLKLRDRSLGRVAVDGRVVAGATDMRIEGFDLDLGTPLAGDLLAAIAGDRIGEVWAELDLAGTTQLEALVSADAWRLDVRPERFALTRGGRRMSAIVESGVLDISDAGMSINNLAVRSSDGTSAMFDGTADWAKASLQGRFELDGSLGSALVAVMGGPQLNSTLRAIGFDDDGGSRISQGRIELQQLDASPTGTIQADIALRDVRIEAGVELDHVNGRLRLDMELRGDDPTGLQLQVLDAHGLFGRLAMHDVTGAVVSDDDGVIQLQRIAGTLAEGRLVVEGSVNPADESWMVNVVLAGARLESMSSAAAATGTEGDSHVASGRVDSSVRLRGQFKSPATRWGAGRFRIVEGDLGPLPLAIGLQQLLHLSMPLVEGIDYADVQFHIDGDQAVLDDIVLEASSGDIAAFSMLGSGTLDWATMSVDVRLRPRGGWLVLRDIIGLMQDQFYEISVTGSLLDPEVDVIALPGLSER